MPTPHMIETVPTTAVKHAPTPTRPTAAAKPAARPEEGNGLRILTYLQLHWLKIVFCGLILGSGGAYAAWELLATKYESTALLQVQSVPEALGITNSANLARTDFVTYIKTTSALIKSDFVLNAALRDLKDSPTIKAQKDPIKYLEEELLVTCPDGSEVIRVTFKSHDPADAKRIVDAVQKAFMSEVIMKEIQEKQVFVKKVEDTMLEIRKALDRNVDSLEKTFKPVAAAGNATPPPNTTPANPLPPIAPGLPMVPGGPPGAPGVAAAPNNPAVQPPALMDLSKINPAILVQKVANLQNRLVELPLMINDEKRRLTLLQQKMDAIKNAPPSQLTIDSVDRDPEVVFQTLKTKAAKREYEFRAKSGDPNSPGVLELKDIWEAHEAKLAQMKKDKIDLMERDKRIAEANKVGLEMEEVIRRLQRLQEEYETVKSLLNQSETQLAQIPNLKGVGLDGHERFNAELSKVDSTDSLYRRLVQQYYLTQMQLNSPPRVKLIQSASNPAQKDMKKQIIGTVFAGLMGFGLMVLGVIAFETVTKKVSSLVDVKGASAVPVVGVIPCLPGEAVGRDPLKRAAANEAIDKLRAYVSQTWLARGATTVAVTSPLADEGKAFTAFGLASSLAQCGYKTLIVDFDLRDPQLHAFAGLANQTGVCELLRAETDPRAAIQFLPSGLHLLTAGKWSDEARKAATGERLEALLGKLKGPYDCVVLHGHALLTAAESVEAARRCEVVLVCALYRNTTMPLLKRAAERIAAMEIPYSGVVYLGATSEESLC